MNAHILKLIPGYVRLKMVNETMGLSHKVMSVGVSVSHEFVLLTLDFGLTVSLEY